MHQHVALIILLCPLLAEVARNPEENQDLIFASIAIKVYATNSGKAPAAIHVHTPLPESLTKCRKDEVGDANLMPVQAQTFDRINKSQPYNALLTQEVCQCLTQLLVVSLSHLEGVV
jgi:hypothetical protein